MSLQAALQDGQPMEALEAAVAARRAELLESRTAVGATLAAESEPVRGFVALEAATVERAFLDFFHLLELCARHREAPEGEDWLGSARANLALVQQRLNLSLERLRESLLSERGPYTNPALNRVLQAPAADLSVAVDEELSRLDLLLGPGHLGTKLRQELLPEELHAYAQLQIWLEIAPQSATPTWLEQGARIGAAFARCDRDFVRRHYQRTPTSMPAMNLVLHALHFCAQGTLTPSTRDWFVEDARTSLASLRSRLQQHAPEGVEQVLGTLDQLMLELAEPNPTTLLGKVRELESLVNGVRPG